MNSLFTIEEGNIEIARFLNLKERPYEKLFFSESGLWLEPEDLGFHTSFDILVPICRKFRETTLTKKGVRTANYHFAEFIQCRMYHMHVEGVWDALVAGIIHTKKSVPT